MGLFHYVKDPNTGKTRIVQQDETVVEPIKVTPTTTLPGMPQRFRCTIEGCGKKFATQGVASIHYNRTHRQGESKDEWRSFVEKVAE